MPYEFPLHIGDMEKEDIQRINTNLSSVGG